MYSVWPYSPQGEFFFNSKTALSKRLFKSLLIYIYCMYVWTLPIVNVKFSMYFVWPCSHTQSAHQESLVQTSSPLTRLFKSLLIIFTCMYVWTLHIVDVKYSMYSLWPCSHTQSAHQESLVQTVLSTVTVQTVLPVTRGRDLVDV